VPNIVRAFEFYPIVKEVEEMVTDFGCLDLEREGEEEDEGEEGSSTPKEDSAEEEIEY
jgi:hypothetical protein